MHPTQRRAFYADRRNANHQLQHDEAFTGQMQEKLSRVPGLPVGLAQKPAAIFNASVQKPEVVTSKSVQLPQDEFVFVNYSKLQEDTIGVFEKILTGGQIEKATIEELLQRTRQAQKNGEMKRALKFGVTQDAARDTIQPVLKETAQVKEQAPAPRPIEGNMTFSRQPDIAMRKVTEIVALPDSNEGMYTVKMECGHMTLSKNQYEAHCKVCAGQVRRPFSRYGNRQS